MEENKLKTISKLFEGAEIRSVWDPEKEDYWFSVVDVVAALTGSKRARLYWANLKYNLKKEGSQVISKCDQLTMLAPDGKTRKRMVDSLFLCRLNHVFKQHADSQWADTTSFWCDGGKAVSFAYGFIYIAN